MKSDTAQPITITPTELITALTHSLPRPITANNFLHSRVRCAANYIIQMAIHAAHSNEAVICSQVYCVLPMPRDAVSMLRWLERSEQAKCLLYGFLHFTVLSPRQLCVRDGEKKEKYFNNVMVLSVGFWADTTLWRDAPYYYQASRFLPCTCNAAFCAVFVMLLSYLSEHSSLLTYIDRVSEANNDMLCIYGMYDTLYGMSYEFNHFNVLHESKMHWFVPMRDMNICCAGND